ncbi:hypothetical protein G9A89_000358 [Geosiphon pyriformis]|nr:hypothetical protein G9A89_000358 [Geosiphon pyriformis]
MEREQIERAAALTKAATVKPKQKSTAGANQIALGLNQLMTEQRQARIDDKNRRQKEKVKTPTDLYGEGGILKLLRWGGVADETALPPVHMALANAGRGKNGGMTHQRALQIAEMRKLRSWNSRT